MSDPDNREETLFNAALQLATPEERAAYLKGACPDDEPLRKRVLALLQGHHQIDAILDQPLADLPVRTLLVNTAMIQPTEKAGDKIGRYKLLQQIGEGGFGVVYMADQEEPVKRRVALKIIKLGMDTKQVIARFEAERQALALMDHPNIAKVFDAGSTETGRPYFVMELVHGIRITDYCDQNKLATTDRLKLFDQVCHAIQHAHQKGIIHRDIKPSNILVTMHDGMPVPKVIDFGIAKATEQRLTDKTLFTAFEQFMGTPAYMSPEQAEMSGLGIDTRSDIYSLGVLLYELLTGNTPFDGKELLRSGLDEMRRTIREKEPSRPSARLSTMLTADLTTVAKYRQADPSKLTHSLRGDLDWIVMKTLEKDRTRRYETVNGLAADIQRYLQNEPVVARPPGNLYRLQKMVRRNKLLFVACSVVCAALILGLASSIFFLIKEKQQRTIAERALQESKISEAKARTAEKASETVTRQVLEGAKLYNAEKPNLKSEAAFYQSLLQLQKRVLGDDSVDAVATLCNLADCLNNEQKQDEAEAVMREAVAMRKRIPGAEQPDISIVFGRLADVLQKNGKKAEARANFSQAFRLMARNYISHAPESSNTNKMQKDFADIMQFTNVADLHFWQLVIIKAEEASLFVANLKDQGQLPGCLKDEHGNASAGVILDQGESSFDPETYPVSVSVYCTQTTGDVSHYNYTVVQTAKDSAWKLQRAWRTSSDGTIIKEYPVDYLATNHISWNSDLAGPDTLTMMTHLAISYDEVGRGDEALNLRQEALALSQKLNPELQETVKPNTSILAVPIITNAPNIMVQPASETAIAGRSITFYVLAAGNPPLSFQWLHDNNPMPGQTNDVLTINPAGPDDSGYYSVQVTNRVGNAISSNATLTIVRMREETIAEINFQEKQPPFWSGAFTWSDSPLLVKTNVTEVAGAGVDGTTGLVVTANFSSITNNIPQGSAGFGVSVGVLARSTNGINTDDLNLYKLYATVKTSGLVSTNSHGRVSWQFESSKGLLLNMSLPVTFTTNYLVFPFVVGSGNVENCCGGSISEFTANLGKVNSVGCNVTADDWINEYSPAADSALYIGAIKFVRLVPIATNGPPSFEEIKKELIIK